MLDSLNAGRLALVLKFMNRCMSRLQPLGPIRVQFLLRRFRLRSDPICAKCYRVKVKRGRPLLNVFQSSHILFSNECKSRVTSSSLSPLLRFSRVPSFFSPQPRAPSPPSTSSTLVFSRRQPLSCTATHPHTLASPPPSDTARFPFATSPPRRVRGPTRVFPPSHRLSPVNHAGPSHLQRHSLQSLLYYHTNLRSAVPAHPLPFVFHSVHGQCHGRPRRLDFRTGIATTRWSANRLRRFTHARHSRHSHVRFSGETETSRSDLVPSSTVHRDARPDCVRHIVALARFKPYRRTFHLDQSGSTTT